jgi:hypothetical protein
MTNFSFDDSLLKYTIPASIIAGYSILLWINQSILTRLEVVIGLCVLLITILVITKRRQKATVLWDRTTGILITVRNWYVEVSAYRQLGSVPIGIDLTHSAERVLESMNTCLSPDDNAIVCFFVTRPLGSGRTIVGFSVHRQSLRLSNGISKASKMSDKLSTDIAILESAMRSAYPHVAVMPTTLDETRIISTGGFFVIAS